MRSALLTLRDLNQGVDKYNSGDVIELTKSEFGSFLEARQPLYFLQKQRNNFNCDAANSSSVQGRKTTFAKAQYYRCRRGRSISSARASKKANTSPSKKRTRVCPNTQCDCRFIALHHPTEDRVRIEWSGSHNHPLATAHSLSQGQLAPEVRAWIQARVREGQGWQEIKELLRYDPEEVRRLYLNGIVPDAMFVKDYHVHAIVRRELLLLSRKATGLQQSFAGWADEIQAAGGATLHLERTPAGGNQLYTWVFAFASKWQRELLCRPASIICLDSTHCTCVGMSVSEKVYLYTVCVRNAATGQGAPVAFMLTSSESSPPLTLWLKHLSRDLGLQPANVMIDCSTTEAAAISATWGHQTKILYCYWHVLRAVNKAALEKLRLLDLAKSDRIAERDRIKSGFRNCMLLAKTKDDFEARWASYLSSIEDQPEWLTYCRRQWGNVEDTFQSRWAEFGRQGHHDGIMQPEGALWRAPSSVARADTVQVQSFLGLEDKAVEKG
ncbi:unnamed protein product [Parajaminaea phylloscopi]